MGLASQSRAVWQALVPDLNLNVALRSPRNGVVLALHSGGAAVQSRVLSFETVSSTAIEISVDCLSERLRGECVGIIGHLS